VNSNSYFSDEGWGAWGGLNLKSDPRFFTRVLQLVQFRLYWQYSSLENEAFRHALVPRLIDLGLGSCWFIGHHTAHSAERSSMSTAALKAPSHHRSRYTLSAPLCLIPNNSGEV